MVRICRNSVGSGEGDLKLRIAKLPFKDEYISVPRHHNEINPAS